MSTQTLAPHPSFAKPTERSLAESLTENQLSARELIEQRKVLLLHRDLKHLCAEGMIESFVGDDGVERFRVVEQAGEKAA